MTFGLICLKLLGSHFFKMLITSGRPPTGSNHRVMRQSFFFPRHVSFILHACGYWMQKEQLCSQNGVWTNHRMLGPNCGWMRQQTTYTIASDNVIKRETRESPYGLQPIKLFWFKKIAWPELAVMRSGVRSPSAPPIRSRFRATLRVALLILYAYSVPE
jgi:hypothetical protein